ncbi:MAG TPA: septation protein A [Gammaproteobacteria bacterium]|nr:septation protein A [Gammaproteobacteria bacterium]
MKLLFDFFPLILFFAAYKWYGIFVATGVAIAASIIQVSVHWLRNRRFETAHLTTLGVIVVFGGLTLIFRDDTFIKWKPTIVNWIFAVIVLASLMGQRRTVLEFLLGEKIHLPVTIWRKVNLAWGLFFLVAGALNYYVAFVFRSELDPQLRTDLWVNFKVFGLMGLTLVFAVIQMMLVARYIVTDNGDGDGDGDD